MSNFFSYEHWFNPSTKPTSKPTSKPTVPIISQPIPPIGPFPKREKIKIGDIISIENIPRNIMSINYLGGFITQYGKVISINDNDCLITINGNIKLVKCSSFQIKDSLVFETYNLTYGYQAIKIHEDIYHVKITKNVAEDIV